MDLIGLSIFFVILAISLPTLVYMQHKSMMELRTSTTANEFNIISKAANLYIEANYTSILSNGGNATITINDLEQAGYLPTIISDTNPYNSTWKIQVEEPKSGYLQGVITANGGMTLNQEELGSIIAQTHGNGGEVLPQNTNISGEDNGGTIAYGAYGGWKLDLSGYNNPGQGHLVGLLNYYNGEQINNDYLYRDSISGHPELNTMQTNIDMGNNDINNVNVVQTGQPTISPNCTQMDSEGHCVGQIMAAGTSESNFPNEWWGGVMTRDLYSQDGTIAVGPGQQNANGNNFVDLYLTDRAYNNTLHTGGFAEVNSPTNQYSAWMTASDGNSVSGIWSAGPNSGASLKTGNGNTEISDGYYSNGQGITSGGITSNSSGSIISAQSLYGADTYIYANDDGNPQDTGLTTDGNIILGHDQNGACSPNSRIYLAGSQLYDGCDGDLHLIAGGGSGSAIVTNAAVELPAIAVAGNSCQSGEIAGDANGSGQMMNCVNGVWNNGGAFSTIRQVSLQNDTGRSALISNTTGKTEFVSLYCDPTWNQNGLWEGGVFYIYNMYGQQVGQTSGRVSEGGSDADFAAAPSLVAMVPAGGYILASGNLLNHNCSAEVAY